MLLGGLVSWNQVTEDPKPYRTTLDFRPHDLHDPGARGHGYLPRLRVSPGSITITLVGKLPSACLNCVGVPFRRGKVP